jgi:hypothetical protein
MKRRVTLLDTMADPHMFAPWFQAPADPTPLAGVGLGTLEKKVAADNTFNELS